MMCGAPTHSMWLCPQGFKDMIPSGFPTNGAVALNMPLADFTLPKKKHHPQQQIPIRCVF